MRELNMDNTVKLNFNKPTNVTFGMEIEGIGATDVTVRFVINCGQCLIAVNATKNNGTYIAAIPAIPLLTVGRYNYSIEVITQGYYFAPLTGEVEVVESVVVTPTIAPTSDVVSEPVERAPLTTSQSNDEEIPFIFANSTREFTELDVDTMDFKQHQAAEEQSQMSTEQLPAEQQTQPKPKLKSKLLTHSEEQLKTPSSDVPIKPVSADDVKQVLSDFNQEQKIKRLKAETDNQLDGPEERERKAQQLIQGMKKEQQLKNILGIQ